MNIIEKDNIIGVPEGVYYGQQDRVDELNQRIGERHFSDMPMKPYYDVRPVPTKYAFFPVIDRVKNVEEPKKFYLDHNVEINFTPSTSKSHCAGYFKNIDNEHDLRNQTRYLQKHETTRPYIPKGYSELYRVSIPNYSDAMLPKEHMHPLLFEKNNFEGKSFNRYVGRMRINNHTRQQMRSMDT